VSLSQQHTQDILYLQSRTIIPVPGTEDFIINFGSPVKSEASRTLSTGKNDEITTFMGSVIDTALQQIAEDIRTDRRSRWAGTWSNFRYYHTWYFQEPWENRGFSYKTYLLSLENNIRNYSVQFYVNINHAMTHGLTVKDLDTIRSAMKAYSNNTDVKFFNDRNYLKIDRITLVQNLDDKLRDDVANILAEMISNFTPIINNITDDKNVASQHTTFSSSVDECTPSIV
jgi:hypothetical protein